MSAAAPAADLARFLRASREWADLELDRALPRASGARGEDAVPSRLAEAMRYAVFGQGKRLRPALVRLVSLALGGDDARAAAPAVAVECVHTYSLVHDDLPCMDDDDLRRGRPTCHKVFGEALAVLAGDALLTFAFEVLAREPRAGDLAGALARGAGPAGMVGGQELDLAPPGAPTLALVAEIHARKTAALLGAAAELGAIAAGAGDRERGAARDYGRALGLCFQATDDVLDVTGDAATLGKTPGKDARARKPTLVAVLGLDGAREEAARLAGAAREAARSLGAREGDLALALVEGVLARRA